MPQFGFNVNNRKPLLSPDYPPAEMIDLGVQAEALGFDSVWVGDSLLEKPRLEPVSVLTAIATRTDAVGLGTACMLTTLRHPVQFAQAWATLDMLSDGRTILGACMGTPYELNRKQHELVGIPPEKRATALEEGIEIMKTLWREGRVDYDGEIYDLNAISFDTGTEEVPLAPIDDEPPILIISNPSYFGDDPVLDRAVRRIVEIGNGWMTANRADQPEEYKHQYDAIVEYARDVGVDPADLHTAYQITFNINESQTQAEKEMYEYVTTYYPSIDDPDFDSWGPVGSPDHVIEWIDDFYQRGCETFIIRFGADDQQAQLERFANEVLPSF